MNKRILLKELRNVYVAVFKLERAIKKRDTDTSLFYYNIILSSLNNLKFEIENQ